MSVRIRGTVTAVEVDPAFRDRLRRWLIRVRVNEVLEGDVDADEVTLLSHSPSLAFQAPDPLGRSYLMSFDEPLADPYLGQFEARPDG